MKKKHKISLGTLVVIASGAIVFFGLHHSPKLSSQERKSEEVAGVDELIMPSSYKDGEDIVMYLTGTIEEPCSQLKAIEVTRNRKKIGIRPIVDEKIDYEKCEDKFAPVQYEKAVRIKEVPYGLHKVFVGRSNGPVLKKEFDRNAKGVFESYLAAEVSMEVPDAIESGRDLSIQVKGFLPNGCHKPDYVEAYVDDDIIKIYPNALKLSSSTEVCTDMLVPYESKVTVGDLIPGRYLVWLMDGETNYKVEKVLDVLRNDVDYVKFTDK